MANEQDQPVAVRRLPDGDPYAATLGGLTGHLLRIDLLPVAAEASFKAGDLIEICCEKTLYLGEVRSCSAGSIVVGVEHALDRERLGLIQQVWHGPSGQ